MSIKGLEMLRKHMSYYDFDPDETLALGNVLDYARQAEEEVSELESENAKLRELLEMMYGCAKGPDCDDCKMLNDGYACAYIMRELGVEVDE